MKKTVSTAHVLFLLLFFCCLSSAPVAFATEVPPGLFDTDPMVRLVSVQEVGRNKIKAAEDTIVTMAEEDSFAGVREAACKALQDLGAVWHINTLKEIATQDPEASVRNAAAMAVSVLQRKADQDTALPQTAAHDKRYRLPAMTLDKNEPRTRHLGLGIGVMGGYGAAAFHLRGRIPTGLKFLPWVGLEAGGGWTPPALYVVTTGPIDKVNGDDKWKIVSAAGGVLLYAHRMHYAAIRAGFDIGRGVYALLGYGLEVLNDEGFFSWGVEAGILIQPMIEDKIDHVVVCDPATTDCNVDMWPVIPFVRFSIHFYPI